ncbi:chromate efflux transporter [Stappia sp. F7233]|uniref:Chromate efflux transporter n=1 Tax=Stappia albiluteola TaxID=2758565 RepID=A0A839AE11_9HYPH|nr:chromate efflux transporter [Stappia albiluteola]MBA5777375.1 chromate efflux transporter [Stappia albiluteola]
MKEQAIDMHGKIESPAGSPPSFTELAGISLRVGLLSFGGPAAQIALMHRYFVEERGWIAEDRFLHALNYCMLLPGPEAQQLATYCGWLLHRVKGGLTAGLLFILPGAVAMLGLSFVYVLFGRLPLVESLFYGVKAGVLAIVLQALLKVGSRALKSRLSIAIAIASFLALFLFGIPFPAVIVAAALVAVAADRKKGKRAAIPPQDAATPPRPGFLGTLAVGLSIWALPVVGAAVLISPDHLLVDVAGFFSTLAVVSFGGAYALLSYMAQVAVESYGWLSAGEMLDGLGLAETTPGPLILVTQFVGFLAGFHAPAPFPAAIAATLAAAMTTWVTFAPSFLFIFLGAPFIERLRGNRRLSAALSGITAAVTGTIANLALWFALHVFFAETTNAPLWWIAAPIPTLTSIDPLAVALALVAGWLVFFRKLGVATVVGASAVLGLAARTAIGMP